MTAGTSSSSTDEQDRVPEAWIDKFGPLAAGWRELSQRTNEIPEGWHEALKRLSLMERRLRAHGKWARGPHDLMGILWLANKEVRLCRVLRWLLDPQGSHGLGTGFLSRLLSDWKVFPEKLTAESVSVIAEQDRNGTRADLFILGMGWSVVIEAKVSAPEQKRPGEKAREGVVGQRPDFRFLD
jgi:hypothetical protein